MVTAAIDLYFKGVSLRGIADHLNQQYGFKLTHVTVLRWIRKYLAIIRLYVRRLRPKLSKKWHADEMRVKVGGSTQNLWNLLDHRSRYLVAVQVTKRKGSVEAKRLLNKGLKSGKPTTTRIVSDGLPSYQKAIRDINQNHGYSRLSHIADRGLVKRNSNNRVERLNGTVRRRLKTMAGLKNNRSSRIFAEDFRSYYNNIRGHTALRGRTPSEVTGVWKAKEPNRWRSLIRDSQNLRV
jgi:transposase-like protein